MAKLATFQVLKQLHLLSAYYVPATNFRSPLQGRR